MEAFRDEIARGAIQPLRESAPDVDLWNAEIAEIPSSPTLLPKGEGNHPLSLGEKGRGEGSATWLEVPWYFAETLFYRKLLEAVRYFQPGAWQGVDPFQKAKERQIAADIHKAAAEWSDLSALSPHEAFEVLIHSCLWGNRTDLSNHTVTRRRADRHQILIDDSETLYQLLSAGVRRLDFINDNCGIDFLTDLALADFLLAKGWVAEIVMHLKPQPFFVSDVMIKDAEAMIAALCASDSAMLAALGQRLRNALFPHPQPLPQRGRGAELPSPTGRGAELPSPTGRGAELPSPTGRGAELPSPRGIGAGGEGGGLRFTTHPFWPTPFMFRHMPADLRTELSQANLVILKGDVNYRRLLDDRHWPFTARMEEIAAYFPTHFATLRTFKCELAVGLQPGQAEQIATADPDWLLNGQRGVIQFVGHEN
jgi:hypothetical protein